MQCDAELRNWFIYRSYSGSIHAQGEIYNDSKGRFKDGEVIRTSVITDLDGHECILYTLNTRYYLGYSYGE